MGLSDASAWTSFALIPASAGIAWALRRWATGAFSVRLRPHFVIGYIALATAVLHMLLSMPAMTSANALGLWFATAATFGLGAQAFLGTNLQSPGIYRRPLRRWHVVLFWATAVLAVAHVVLTAIA